MSSEKARRKWNLREMATAATRMKRLDYLEFRMLCYVEGKTVYRVLQELIAAWMNDHRGGPPAALA